MKREIKFRLWDISEMNMISDKDINYGYVFDNYYNADALILMQFTGLTDKNGKEIYEGDIIENEFGKKIVKWEEGRFYCEEEGNLMKIEMWFLTYDKIEVIGNIYENPELLTK